MQMLHSPQTGGTTYFLITLAHNHLTISAHSHLGCLLTLKNEIRKRSHSKHNLTSTIKTTEDDQFHSLDLNAYALFRTWDLRQDVMFYKVSFISSRLDRVTSTVTLVFSFHQNHKANYVFWQLLKNKWVFLKILIGCSDFKEKLWWSLIAASLPENEWSVIN